jgi:hypothetical protein
LEALGKEKIMDKYEANQFMGREWLAIESNVIFMLCSFGFSDTSFGNDACPSFSRDVLHRDTLVGTLQLFVDAADSARREVDFHGYFLGGGAKRFIVHWRNAHDTLVLYASFDSISDALKECMRFMDGQHAIWSEMIEAI